MDHTTPSERPSEDPPRRHLEPDLRDELHRRLEAEKRRLLDLYQETTEREEGIVRGDVEDVVDRAEEGWDREEVFRDREDDRRQLLLVEEALERLEGGTYGLCLYCGRPIDEERLAAVPSTRYCAEDQEKLERGEIDERRPYDWPTSGSRAAR